MKKKNISDALNNIDFDMVEDVYESTKQKKKSPKSLWSQWGAMAACLALMIIVTMAALPQLNAPHGSREGSLIDNASPSEGHQIDNTTPSGTEVSATDEFSTGEIDNPIGEPSPIAPKEFASIEEFVAYEKNLGEASSKCYYIPSALGDDYELYSILRQEKSSTTIYEHITVKYKLKGVDIDEESFMQIYERKLG